MAIATKVGAKWDYVLACDQDLPEEQQTVWQIQSIPLAAREAVESMIQLNLSDGGFELDMAKLMQAMRIGVSYGVAGWSNFVDEDGGLVEPKYTKRKPPGASESVETLSDDSVMAIGEHRTELFDQVCRRNGIVRLIDAMKKKVDDEPGEDDQGN